MKSKVVVTGIGVISPIGNSINEFSDSLFSGKSGVDNITRFDTEGLDTCFAAEIKNHKSSFKDVKISYALDAAAQAMFQAFGKDINLTLKRTQLSIGIGLELFSLPDLIESRSKNYQEEKNHRDAMTFLNTPSDICAHQISHQYQFNHPPMIHISACAASTDAIGHAYEAIRSGRVDVALAGGTDSMINPMGLVGFSRIGALSKQNENPTAASKPFDKHRDGFVLGEGAGFLVLESEKSANDRNATILAEISGYGQSLDAYSVSDPRPDGSGATRAMKGAIKSANLTCDDISAVNAHGTSTPKNDPAEAKALQLLLGDRISSVPVSSTKSMIGHLISASGAVETIAVIESLQKQRMHATVNLDVVDESCQLHHIKHQSCATELKHVLKNSFGFGGKNACLIISAVE